VVGTISPDGKTITFNSPEAAKLVSSQEGHTQGAVFKLVGSDYHSEAFEFITTAARQIREVLGLMRK
jgi:Tol biopolymer transport system component